MWKSTDPYFYDNLKKWCVSGIKKKIKDKKIFIDASKSYEIELYKSEPIIYEKIIKGTSEDRVHYVFNGIKEEADCVYKLNIKTNIYKEKRL